MEDEDERNRKDDEDKLLDELAAQGCIRTYHSLHLQQRQKEKHCSCLVRRMRKESTDLSIFIL